MKILSKRPSLLDSENVKNGLKRSFPSKWDEVPVTFLLFGVILSATTKKLFGCRRGQAGTAAHLPRGVKHPYSSSDAGAFFLSVRAKSRTLLR